MKRRTSIEIIAQYLPSSISERIMDFKSDDNITEIRLRAGKAVSIVKSMEYFFLTSNGGLTRNFRNINCIHIEQREIASIVEKLAHNSVHSAVNEFQQGYFVIENGIRVGLAGAYSEGSNRTLRDFNSLNFRVSRELMGCAEKIYNELRISKQSILICGEVNSGKTTILRDMARLVGNMNKVCVVDERNEISAIYRGVPTFDMGEMTDIISGIGRADGINMALRTLSPDYIICDEISTNDDALAIMSAFGSGIRFIATLHAGGIDDLYSRDIGRLIVDSGVFDIVVFLDCRFKGKIKEIRRMVKNA